MQKADDNLTLSHPDKGIRDFWIEHGKRTREIAAKIGEELGSACINNIWVPDGYKDYPIDRISPRKRLRSLSTKSSHKNWIPLRCETQLNVSYSVLELRL